MALAIATNTGALMAAASATSVNKDMETSMERLSTGKRINSAADDAAGVAIASRLSSEIRGTNQAIRNAQDGQALIDTAEGAHKEIENILQRMRELAVQSANDTNDSTDRSNLQAEFSALTTEIDRIAGATTWAGQDLLTGAGGGNSNGTFNLQVGGNTGSVDTIAVAINAMTTAALGSGTETSGAVTTAGVTAVSAVSAVSVVSATSAVTETGSVVSGTVYEITLDDNNGNTLTVTGAATTGTTADDGLTSIVTAFNALSDAKGFTMAVASNTLTVTRVDGVNFDIALGSGDTAANLTIPAATTTDGVEAVTAVTAVTGVAEIAQVDASGYTITEGKTYTLNVGDVELSYTAADGDDYDDLVTGFTADADYDATAFTVTQSGGTFSITQASTGAITSPTITFDDGLFDISDRDAALTSIDLMDVAIAAVNTQRAELGAVSNRLDNTVNNLTSITIQLEGGRGRIEDADFAAESTSLAKAQILQQASTAMLAQANASKQSVLSLLQG
jgi:flagellin